MLQCARLPPIFCMTVASTSLKIFPHLAAKHTESRDVCTLHQLMEAVQSEQPLSNTSSISALLGLPRNVQLENLGNK